MADDPQNTLIAGLLAVVEPIESAVQDKRLEPLLADIGWIVGANDQLSSASLLGALAGVPNAVAGVRSLLASPPQDIHQLGDALDKVAAIVGAVQQVKTLFDANAPAEFKQIGSVLVSYLTARTIEYKHPAVFLMLRVLGIIRDTPVSGFAELDQANQVRLFRHRVLIPQFDFDQLLRVIKDPAAALKREYNLEGGLVDPNGTADKLFPRLRDLLAIMGLQATYGLVPTVPANLGTYGSHVVAHSLRAYKEFETTDDSLVRLGAMLFLDGNLGLMVLPIGGASITQDVGNWALSFTLSATGKAFAIKNGALQLPAGVSRIDTHFAAVKKPSSAEAGLPGERPVDATVFRIGGRTGTRFELGEFALKVDASLAGTSFDYGFELDANKGAVVLAASDTDGFLSSVLPPGESKATFDFSVGWSRLRGLRFGGGATLDVALPVNLTIAGTLKVNNVHLTVVVGDGAVDLSTRASVALKIGPVTATVDRIGLGANVTFPADGGNIGPANAVVGFRPPTGLGIAIESGAVSGGGFLSFDTANGRYTGAVELTIYDVAVKAFGVVETKIPGGGFSFAIVISAEFTPIQLGFGFTLIGVGGLIGINRTVSSKAISDAVRGGTLDQVLFPHNLIANAPAIVNELGTLFPPAKGHYVFGPLAKLGWGTPTLVTGTLGLILELPGSALTILGTVRARLPKPDAPLVFIDLDVGGQLDFAKKHFELSAMIGKDSRVGDYPVSGSMAMLLDWGDRPNFAISLGGFNAAFNPPPKFPQLRPVSIDLGVRGDPSITLTGYLALTSNTAQVGAKLVVYVSAGIASLTGTIGFDALFTFSPFTFNAKLSGKVTVHFLVDFSLFFDGTISGPSPWYINGRLCVSYFFDSACVGFDLTLNTTTPQQPTLPSRDPWLGFPLGLPLADQEVGGLKPAILDTRNWSGRIPAGALTGVSYIERKAPAETPIDPMGVATLRQKVVPIDFDISRFAGTTPTRTGKLKINSVQAGAIPADVTPAKDYFAPGQYRKMSNNEALSAPSFQLLQSGVELQSTKITLGGAVPQPVTYDTFVLDAQGTLTQQPQPHTLPDNHLAALWRTTAASRRSARLSGSTRFIDATQSRKITDVLATVNVTFKATLANVPGLPINLTHSEAAALVDEKAGNNPLLRQQYQIVSSHLAA